MKPVDPKFYYSGSSSPEPYIYNAQVVKITDGDTFDLDVDLGFKMKYGIRVRLVGLICGIHRQDLGVDAWEKRGSTKELGDKAESFVRKRMKIGDTVRVQTKPGQKVDGFRRWLAVVFINIDGEWLSIGDILLEQGLARVWWQGIAKQLRPIEEGRSMPE